MVHLALHGSHMRFVSILRLSGPGMMYCLADERWGFLVVDDGTTEYPGAHPKANMSQEGRGKSQKSGLHCSKSLYIQLRLYLNGCSKSRLVVSRHSSARRGSNSIDPGFGSRRPALNTMKSTRFGIFGLPGSPLNCQFSKFHLWVLLEVIATGHSGC